MTPEGALYHTIAFDLLTRRDRPTWERWDAVRATWRETTGLGDEAYQKAAEEVRAVQVASRFLDLYTGPETAEKAAERRRLWLAAQSQEVKLNGKTYPGR